MNEELGQVYTILTDKTGTLGVRMMCSIMYERLSNSQSTYGEATQKHINDYADAGLRTLVLAYRQLEEIEYTKFERNFTAAKNSVSADRDELIDEATDLIERDLILFGATAVEDKLQKGVSKSYLLSCCKMEHFMTSLWFEHANFPFSMYLTH